MRFFWARKEHAEAGDSSWALPFSDMMSLLLAVFVMIAAMGEIRKDGRFTRVGSAVRSSFGFSTDAQAASSGRTTLADRLERAGLSRRIARSLPGAIDPQVSAVCEVTTGKGRVAIEIAGTASFDQFGVQLLPLAHNAVTRIAEFLADSQTRLEVRGHGGDGLAAQPLAFRDRLDLSYARAKAVADLLIASGVSSSRVYVTACGDRETPRTPGSNAESAASRRVEIIVHTDTPVVCVPIIAEKERAENG
jgi:chemotaxis protein MotB